MRLVAKSSAGVEVEVVIVSSDLALTLLHTPEDEGNAAKEESAAYAADNAANDLFVGIAQAAVVIAIAGLRCRRVSDDCLAGCKRDRVGACGSDLDLLAVAFGGEDRGVGLE